MISARLSVTAFGSTLYLCPSPLPASSHVNICHPGVTSRIIIKIGLHDMSSISSRATFLWGENLHSIDLSLEEWKTIVFLHRKVSLEKTLVL